jgi:hypothetical protein
MPKNIRIIPNSGSIYFIADVGSQTDSIQFELSNTSKNVRILDGSTDKTFVFFDKTNLRTEFSSSMNLFATGSNPPASVGGIYYNTTDGNIYRSNGSTWLPAAGSSGTSGSSGSSGSSGTSGSSGSSGSSGTSGSSGSSGSSGTSGSSGSSGSSGTSGAKGQKGEFGPKGPQGSPGGPGPVGSPGGPGNQGNKGSAGDKGQKGELGPKGPTGSPGGPGPVGSPGGPGNQGNKGNTGGQGNKGSKGEIGAPGPQGNKGNTGSPGPQGNKGSTGAKGNTGGQGAKGDNGAPGPQGNKGNNGAPGPQGNKGDTGAPGPQGNKGNTGAPGPQGNKGNIGSQGNKGTKGETGSTAGITSYTNPGNNRIITSVDSTTINAESDFIFDGGNYSATLFNRVGSTIDTTLFAAIKSGSVNSGTEINYYAAGLEASTASISISYKQNELSPNMMHVYNVGGFYFKIFNGSVNTYHRFDSNGKVAWNSSTAPTYAFEISGSTHLKNGAALGVNVAPNATAGRIDASNDIVAFSSDRRLKTNIEIIENPVEKVKSLTGFVYNWNELANQVAGYDTEQKYVGVYAQEVQAVLPEAVKLAPFDNDGNNNSISGENYITVQYEKIVPLLIEAIKEQQQQIDELKKLITNEHSS